MEEADAVQKSLDPGETLLWSARPDPWHYTRPTFMIYIVALPWTIFTFGWLQAITGGFQWPKPTIAPIPNWMPWVAIDAGLILLVAGFWMLSAPFWIWRRGKRIIHVLTSQRALILNEACPKKNEALTLHGKIDFRVTDPEEAISDLDLKGPDGKGLTFRAVRDPQSVVGQLNKQRS